MEKVMSTPNWRALHALIADIKEMSNDKLADWLSGEDQRCLEAIKKGEKTDANTINMWPGVPGRCTPIFLVLLFKGLEPGFYVRVADAFYKWVEGCDGEERFIQVISDEEPEPYHRHLLDWDLYYSRLRDWYLDRPYMHPFPFQDFIGFIENMTEEFSNMVRLMVMSNIYIFLKREWRRKLGHYFSWYIKEGYKLVHFDGQKVW